MWGRAERQAGAGAGVLFARLGDPDERRAAAIAVLERAIARLRAGDWSDALADLVARAAALDASSEGADAHGLASGPTPVTREDSAG
jgi:hypothetical protein